MKYYDKNSIKTRPFFHPIHTLPSYQRDLRFPVTGKLSSMGINLPSGSRLSEAEILGVAETFKESLKPRYNKKLGAH